MKELAVLPLLNGNYFLLSLGRTILSNTATIVAITTGDFPKMVVTHDGNADKDVEAWETPIPKAAASPTMEVFR